LILSSQPRPSLSTHDLSAAKRALLEARLRGHHRGPAVVTRTYRSEAPLSFAQERLWFLDRLQPGSAFYNVPMALRLEGPLDIAALERALGEIVRRHEILRTIITATAGAPAQRIAPFVGWILPVEDLGAQPASERDALLQRRVQEDAARPFDLVRGPLFRVTLLHLAEDTHVLLICLHHIVSDGWSRGVLFRELSVLYAAYRAGRASPLPELAVQYADYAIWQREQVHGETLEQQAAWWMTRLRGAPALLTLPTDRPRPAVQSYRGGAVRFDVSLEALERLRALGRREDVTLYMVLLAAFQVLLAKYSGSEDVVIGSPIAGRTRREVEPLIGCFVNTLVLRTDLSGDPSFRELLRRVREVTLGAFDHQDVPFEKLVADLQPERSLSHAPIFQSLFVLQEAGESRGELPGVTVRGVDMDIDTTKFDLSLNLTVTPRGLAGGLIYGTDLFEQTTIQRMAARLRRVIEDVAADPVGRLSTLILPDAAEHQTIVRDWNRTMAAPPTEGCLHELFEVQVARTPDAMAAIGEDCSLRYRELDRRANRLAHHLRRLGVGPEVRVGLCLERGVDLLVAILGVLKAGGAYVPLDPDYPAERLAYMLADAGVSVVVAQERTRDRLSAFDASTPIVISLDAPAVIEAIAAERTDTPESGVTPENLAYVIYTSGSTGRPKGAMNTHGAVVNRIAWMAATYGLGEDEVMLQKTPSAFDVSVWEMFWPLVQGASLVIARPDGHRDPSYLLALIERYGVTVVQFVPSLLEPFLEIAKVANPSRCASLRRVICGGEALPPALAARVHARFPSVSLINLYGPTETAGAVAHWACERDASSRSVPIGRGIWHARLYVLDAARQPAPVGVAGELYVGGVPVGRGYLHRPALTAERFVPDPFATESGARLYRSGDRARWRADGTLEFLGRLDAQVKIRGMRIELGELEAVLRAHPRIRDCVVVVREDIADDPRLIAYVVGDAETESLRAHLRQHLPDYMTPAAFVTLPHLPLLPNGKLDRHALPAPVYGAAAEQAVAPRTPTEALLVDIWAELLRVESLGVTEGFFDLGGHSLLAMRVIARVRDVFGVDLSLRTLFEAPTVRELARAVDERRGSGESVSPPVMPTERDRVLPLSFAQERLWFLDRLQPGSAFYNVPMALRLEGSLDIAALERALGEIVRRHEILRTTVTDTAGAPAQRIAPFVGWSLPVEELGAQPAAERDAILRRRVQENAARPFDLARGPLFRATLLRVAEETHVLLFCFHHIISDGWSRGVLFRELSALYTAYRDGYASPLPELTVQYADYSAWQREQWRGETLERQVAWWTTRLRGAPALLALPTDHPRPAIQSYRGGAVRLDVPLDGLERLRALGRREGVTLYMVLLAAFQVLLAKYSGSEDVVVGSPIAGRTRREVEPLIGCFVNTLVLRTDLSGDPSFRELLRRVREVTLGAFDHQDVPFEKLVADLQPERSLSHSPLVQVLFTVQETEEDSRPTLTGVRLQPLKLENETTKFDLMIGFATHARGLHAGLTYNSDLFERGTAERMLGHLALVLEQVAADVDVPLAALDLLTGAERRTVVEAWNQTAAAYPVEQCLHQVFDAQAARTPDAVAARSDCDGDGDGDAGTLTWRALSRRANQLAHHLRAVGVGPDVRVALCVERSLDLLVAILGVVKAGGAYVPLDPGYPSERLAYMLADAGVSVVVAQERTRDRLAASAAPTPFVISLDAPAVIEAIAAERTDTPESGVTPQHLAYVIYTSGSTGRPKGAMITHRAAVHHMAWMQAAYPLRADDVVLQKTPSAFDASVWEVFSPVLYGASLVLARPDGHRDPAYLAEAIERHGVTVVQFVPSLLKAFVEVTAPARCATLRRVFCGGEALPPTLVARVHELLPSVSVINLYGPTETAIDVSHWACARDTSAHAVPIGRPIANTQLYVLDRAQQPVPAGVAGELYIGGVQVGRGYLHRPRLTAERFVPDPLAVEPGARLYRTGDRVRWRADGAVEFLGRLDAQVKIRGVRIELGEIEAVLRAQPQVRACAVVAREDIPGEPRLVAYIVGDAETESLRAHLRQHLPEYMVPTAFVPLDQLPLTPSGKLHVEALPAPDRSAAAGPRAEALKNHIEVELSHLWEELLGVEVTSPHVSFFELGGNSLLGIRLLAQIAHRLKCDLPVATLFAGDTIRQLATAILERQDAPPSSSPIVPIQPHGSLPTLFCVHPADRGVGVYFNLARHLGRDQPVFGIRDDGDDPSRPVHQIAAEHVRALRAAQPEGPYYLLGYSFGGNVVYEMAAQLEREGAPVAFAGLVDTIEPLMLRRSPRSSDATIVTQRAAEIAVNMGRSFSLPAEDLEGLSLDEQYRQAVDALHAQGAAPAWFDAAMMRENCETLRGRMVSVERYEPAGTFSGTLTLLRASIVTEARARRLAPLTDEEQRTLGWSAISPGLVDVHWIPGSHYTMRMEPNVRVFAACVRESLAAARVLWEDAPVTSQVVHEHRTLPSLSSGD
jgi:amino acid adenylation domain-containing protein